MSFYSSVNCQNIVYQNTYFCRCFGKKVALLALRRVGLCVGQNQMCHLRAGLKLFLKNTGWEKIKNKGSEMSVGLLSVRCQYSLYVVVHLSKFVSLFSVFTRSMSTVSCRFTLAANGSRLGVVAEYLNKSSIEELYLNLPQNGHTKHCTRHYAKPLLCVRCSSFVLIVCRLRVGTDTLFAKFWSVCWFVGLGNVCGCLALGIFRFKNVVYFVQRTVVGQFAYSCLSKFLVKLNDFISGFFVE